MFGLEDTHTKIEVADKLAETAWVRMTSAGDLALNSAVTTLSRPLDESDFSENGLAALKDNLDKIVRTTSNARAFTPEVELFVRPLKIRLTKAYGQKLGRTKFKQIEDFIGSNSTQQVDAGVQAFVDETFRQVLADEPNNVLRSKLTIGIMRLRKVYAAQGTAEFASQHIPAAKRLLKMLEDDPSALRRYIPSKEPLGEIGGLLVGSSTEPKAASSRRIFRPF